MVRRQKLENLLIAWNLKGKNMEKKSIQKNIEFSTQLKKRIAFELSENTRLHEMEKSVWHGMLLSEVSVFIHPRFRKREPSCGTTTGRANSSQANLLVFLGQVFWAAGISLYRIMVVLYYNPDPVLWMGEREKKAQLSGFSVSQQVTKWFL